MWHCQHQLQVVDDVLHQGGIVGNCWEEAHRITGSGLVEVTMMCVLNFYVIVTIIRGVRMITRGQYMRIQIKYGRTVCFTMLHCFTCTDKETVVWSLVLC